MTAVRAVGLVFSGEDSQLMLAMSYESPVTCESLPVVMFKLSEVGENGRQLGWDIFRQPRHQRA
jgi:hypothetical protein